MNQNHNSMALDDRQRRTVNCVNKAYTELLQILTNEAREVRCTGYLAHPFDFLGF
jgi:hypothetical protein